MAAFDKAIGLDLKAFYRGVDESDRAAAGALLGQHVPGFERLAHLQLDAAIFNRAAEREAEFALRREPFGIEVIAGAGKIGEHAGKILPDEMRQHETVM